MSPSHASRIREWFLSLTRGYRSADGRLPYPLRLKVSHSGRVSWECRRIAMGEGWPEDRVRAAGALGLLHDVGRFEQYRRFATLSDRRSVDHGEQGYEQVAASGLLDPLPALEREAILLAIRYHNRQSLPPGLEESCLPLVRLIRDADKLDIFRVVRAVIREKRFENHPEILLDIRPEGGVSPELVEEVWNTRSASYKHMRTFADFRLAQLAWVYDFHYPPSFRALVERGILSELANALRPEGGRVAEIVDRAESDVAARLLAAMRS